MMKINLNFRSGTPIYIQIMDQIKHLLAAGELQPGDQLPTVRQLATDLRVNFNTIARAYRLLDEEGIISTQHGRGTYILDSESEDGSIDMRRDVLDSLARRFIEDAEHLDFSPADVDAIIQPYLDQWKARISNET